MWPPCSRLLVGGLQNLEVTITRRRLCTVANILDCQSLVWCVEQKGWIKVYACTTFQIIQLDALECHSKNITVNIFPQYIYSTRGRKWVFCTVYTLQVFFGSFEQDVWKCLYAATRLVKHLEKTARNDAMDAWKLHFPLKGKSRKSNGLKLSRFSRSQVVLDAFKPQCEVIFPACGGGSFRRFFISLPAGLEFSGRRRGRCPGSASFSAAGERSSRRRGAEDAATCFLCVRRECGEKTSKSKRKNTHPPIFDMQQHFLLPNTFYIIVLT